MLILFSLIINGVFYYCIYYKFASVICSNKESSRNVRGYRRLYIYLFSVADGVGRMDNGQRQRLLLAAELRKHKNYVITDT